MPITEEKKEPMLLLDVTGSMGRAAANGATVSRTDVVQEALKTVVTRLQSHDTAGQNEAGGGGLRTIIFSTGLPNGARDIEDLNTQNFLQKWNSIPWGGSTRIMPGFSTLVQAYTQEFGVNSTTKLLALVITDGEAEDEQAFEQEVQKFANEMYVVIAVVGYGEEHDKALSAYQRIAQSNPHVRAFSIGAMTDPAPVADALLQMIA